MKTDVNGCSTCPSGLEQIEEFPHPFKKGLILIQYEFRHPKTGALYSITIPRVGDDILKTLKKIRDSRKYWDKEQDQIEARAEVAYFHSHPELNP